MTQQYKDPAGGNPSTIGKEQFNEHFYAKKALMEAREHIYFGQLADTMSMPKHMGKTIKKYHYLPLLSDANYNDQGLDTDGLAVNQKSTIVINVPEQVGERTNYVPRYAVGEGANSGAADTAAQATAVSIFKEMGVFDTDYATTKAALLALTPAWEVDDTTRAGANSVPATGNLYGSSTDIGTISGKLPLLTENGGYVNRVGFRRVEVEATLTKLGIYDQYTKESVDFDTDAELMTHINREMVNGAVAIDEDLLQTELLNGAGVIRYAGAAVSTATISGETGAVTQITHNDLLRLSVSLDDNRCPKSTKVITGTRMIDTRTVENAYFMYISSALVPMFKRMKDAFGDQAFISVAKYGAATTPVHGEIGQVDQFRLIVVPEMQNWAGAGATVTTNDGYRETNGKYDVYPALVVGQGAFTQVGFQSGGKGSKFKIKHSKPESDISYAADPFGEKGFMSIKWYHATLVQRPERLAVIKTVAEY